MLTLCRFQSEQAGRALISYVVASSVGNISISDLTEPVQIEISHLTDQVDAWRQSSVDICGWIILLVWFVSGRWF